jgi:hypothetical protein
MEYVTIEISKSLLETLSHLHDLKIDVDYTLKTVEIKDDFFKDDTTHKELKKVSNKAYKHLKEYEFKRRNP